MKMFEGSIEPEAIYDEDAMIKCDEVWSTTVGWCMNEPFILTHTPKTMRLDMWDTRLLYFEFTLYMWCLIPMVIDADYDIFIAWFIAWFYCLLFIAYLLLQFCRLWILWFGRKDNWINLTKFNILF